MLGVNITTVLVTLGTTSVSVAVFDTVAVNVFVGGMGIKVSGTAVRVAVAVCVAGMGVFVGVLIGVVGTSKNELTYSSIHV
jgi:hypothetical protein